MTNLQIVPALKACRTCGKVKAGHETADHAYKRDERLPDWHGWHAARRGLGTTLNKLHVSTAVIQRILRHANIATTSLYYILPEDEEVLDAMATFEERLEERGKQSDTNRTLGNVVKFRKPKAG